VRAPGRPRFPGAYSPARNESYRAPVPYIGEEQDLKQAAITGKRQCAIIDRPDPKVRENFCLVKITSAPMCTEYKAYADGERTETIGHEAAGVVVEAGAMGRVKPGDRVVVMPQYPCGACELCRAGDYIHCEHGVDPRAICGSETGVATYAQYCIKQDWLLLPVPEDVSDDHAAMACCGLGPTFGAMDRVGLAATDCILIMGLGPVGLGAVINATHRGARVIGVDGNAYRAELARKLGALAVLDPADEDLLKQVKSLTGGNGADCAVDCTAVPVAQKRCVELTRRRGSVAYVGWGGGFETGNMIPGGHSLHGCWHWNLTAAPRMMRTIRDCSRQIDTLITHTFPLSRLADAWELQLSGRCGKVILHPWE